jgi:hypothetical protein
VHCAELIARHWLQSKVIQSVQAGSPTWRQSGATLDLCLCLEDARLRSALLNVPVARLEEAVSCRRRMPVECEKSALEAFAGTHMAGANRTLWSGSMWMKLLLVATWLGASVPAVVKQLGRMQVGYEELDALGVCLEQGSSGPVMDLLQVSVVWCCMHAVTRRNAVAACILLVAWCV